MVTKHALAWAHGSVRTNPTCAPQCIDGKKRMCHIRGKMRKKVWIGTGDIVLVGLRDYQDEKADVILKYSADEARVLKQYGELPEHLRINDTDVVLEGEDNENAEFFDFDGEDLEGGGASSQGHRVHETYNMLSSPCGMSFRRRGYIIYPTVQQKNQMQLSKKINMLMLDTSLSSDCQSLGTTCLGWGSGVGKYKVEVPPSLLRSTWWPKR